ncbi:MAG: hypothetical protein HY438_01960 [DPANN group archaeon]|nr:hypothetical protein [DPANN group archaeon]
MQPNNKLKELFGDLETPKEKAIKIEKDRGLEETLAKLSDIYKCARVYDLDWPDKIYKTYFDLLEKRNIKITPESVDYFFSRISYEGGAANGRKMGLLLTAMVQLSFQQGHNNFEIVICNNHPLHLFGMYLRGQPDKKLAIRIDNVYDVMNYKDGEPHAWFNNIAYLDVTLSNVDANVRTFGRNAGSSVFKTDNESLFCELRDRFGTASERTPADKCEVYLLAGHGDDLADVPEPTSEMQLLEA